MRLPPSNASMPGKSTQFLDTIEHSDVERLEETIAGGRQKSPSRSPVVVIGGGIIGLSTAYYLSLARTSGRSITVVDKASVLFAGASGKANGILGDYGFEPEAETLGKLSWELHQQLASVHGGWAGWGYRDVMIYSLHHAASDASRIRLDPTQPPSPLPAWCRDLEGHASTMLSDLEHAARMSVFPTPHEPSEADTRGSNPADFCQFLQKCCEAMGVRILLDATVTDVRVKYGSLESVAITQTDAKTVLGCHSLVIAAGPWSERVLSGLFPNSRVRIPSSKQSNTGNYILLKAPRWDGSQDTRVCHQIYLEGLLGYKVDISSRPDGTLYIGGSLSAQEALPETITDIQPQWKYVCKMKRLAAMVLRCSLNDMEILEVGRAYRPCLEHGRPIVSQVPLDELLGMTRGDPIERRERGGVYLNVGHGCDGITLGPGSGKVMSELIEGGQSMSADISGLGIL